MRKCESKKSTTKKRTLACLVLHNLCIDMDDPSSPNWHEEFEKVSGKTRPANEVCDLLDMTECRQKMKIMLQQQK